MPRFSLGQPARLKTTVTDPATNLLTDPGTISLVVLKPDLTQQTLTTGTSPAVVRDGAGLFHLDYTPATTGPYRYYWLTTGNAAGTTATAGFSVVDPFAPAHITYEDARARLNTSATSDDEVQAFIAAAVAAQEQRVGAVAPRTVTETVTAYCGQLMLATRPVLSITSATLNGVGVSVSGWAVLSPMAGIVTATTRLSGTYTVILAAGRNPVPQDLVEAALLRVMHAEATQRAGGGGAQIIGSGSTDDVVGADSSDFLLILRAQDFEKPYVLPTIA